MALYDPSNQTWYNYNPPAGSGGYDESGNPLPTPLGALPPGLTPTTQPAGANVSGLIDPTQTDAQTLAAQLLQSEFAEWEKYFKPIEEAQMQQLSFVNPTVLPTALKQATQSATGASEAAKGILQRQTQSQGIKPTEQQASTSARILNLQEGANIAGARNTARRQIQQQDIQALMGQMPNYNVVRQALNPVQ